MYISVPLPKTPVVPAQTDLPGKKQKPRSLMVHSPKCMNAVEEICEEMRSTCNVKYARSIIRRTVRAFDRSEGRMLCLLGGFGVVPRRPNNRCSPDLVRVTARSSRRRIAEPPLGFCLPCQNRGLSTPCIDKPVAYLPCLSVIAPSPK